jgi:acyl-CoA thioesterase
MASDAKVMQILDLLTERNPVIKMLGMQVRQAQPGQVQLTMTIQENMVNSHGTCHGGFLFTFCDQTAGYTCMSRNEAAVTQTGQITYISPARLGEEIVAEGIELARSRRSGTYDVRLSGPDGRLVALFRAQFVIVGPEIIPTEG